MNWLLHVLGVDNVSGRYYGFWSGFGSDIGELAIVGGLFTLVKHRTCHVHRCWRLGRHPVEGTPHVVCRKHHPDDHLTAAGVLKAHEDAASAAAAAGQAPPPPQRPVKRKLLLP